MNSLNEILIDSKNYKMDYYVSCDYKMILDILDMQAANSCHTFIWCYVQKDNLRIVGKARNETFDGVCQYIRLLKEN